MRIPNSQNAEFRNSEKYAKFENAEKKTELKRRDLASIDIEKP